MALTDGNGGNGNGLIMPVSPMYGNGMGMNGGFGGDWGWIILLLLIGWGNNGNGGFGGGFGGGAGNLYPWMNQADITTSGFQNAQLSNQLTSIQNSVNGIGTQLCNSFANLETAANARQMANMQQAFDLSSQFANCCCENRLATANLQSTILAENCADRQAISDGIRDILVNQNNNTQRILDQMCQDKIDSKNEKIADLERQLTMANLAASQGAQTAQILADNARQTVALEQYLNPTPIPAYVVQNPNCCQQNTCGCGCGSF